MLTIVPKKAQCSIEWMSRDGGGAEQFATMTCELTSDGALVYAFVSTKLEDGSKIAIVIPADAIATAARLLPESQQATATTSVGEVQRVAEGMR